MKRRDFLSHVSWTGAGIAFALSSEGVVVGRALADAMPSTDRTLFVQISDSHIGFHQPANPDVAATLKSALDTINALPDQPSFVVHTGDVTHLAKAEQFDTAKGLLSTLRARTIVLPGEHDTIGSDPKVFYGAFKPPSGTSGWFSWEEHGIHYIGLVNVFNFEKMGLLGSEQLAWLERDLRGVKRSTPIVVFTHVPLYALYEKWGWTTEDGAKALALLQPFERVTVLNGHIHQVVTHVEGNIHFATAAATAYPQPKPGTAEKPGPVTLPHGDLLHAIGYRRVTLHDGNADIDDHTLA